MTTVSRRKKSQHLPHFLFVFPVLLFATTATNFRNATQALFFQLCIQSIYTLGELRSSTARISARGGHDSAFDKISLSSFPPLYLWFSPLLFASVFSLPLYQKSQWVVQHVIFIQSALAVYFPRWLFAFPDFLHHFMLMILLLSINDLPRGTKWWKKGRTRSDTRSFG